MTAAGRAPNVGCPVSKSSGTMSGIKLVVSSSKRDEPTNMKRFSLDRFGYPVFKREIKFNTQLLRRHFTKVVIQEMPTGRYWESNGVWTTDIDHATIFRTCTAALEQATHLKLQNVQLVMTREIKELEIIPVKTSVRN